MDKQLLLVSLGCEAGWLCPSLLDSLTWLAGRRLGQPLPGQMGWLSSAPCASRPLVSYLHVLRATAEEQRVDINTQTSWGLDLQPGNHYSQWILLAESQSQPRFRVQKIPSLMRRLQSHRVKDKASRVKNWSHHCDLPWAPSKLAKSQTGTNLLRDIYCPSQEHPGAFPSRPWTSSPVSLGRKYAWVCKHFHGSWTSSPSCPWSLHQGPT